MALSNRDIVITPNIGQSTEPNIVFKSGDSSYNGSNITLRAVNYGTSGSLSFEGTTGQLFSVTDSMSGTIFSVNDISGIPSIEILDTGVIKFGQYSGNILVGTSVDNGVDKFQVNGSILGSTIKGSTLTSTVATGTPPLTVSSTTVVTNLNADKWDGYDFASYLNQGVRTDSSPTFGQVYATGWFRNSATDCGLYNEATGNHFYSTNDGYWNIAGNNSRTYGGIKSRFSHQGTLKTVSGYWDSGGFGILNDSGNWSVRGNYGNANSGGSLYGNWEVNTGSLSVSGNVSAYASDKRLKINITPISSPLEKIKKISGVTFDWIDNIEELGFIPQTTHETGVIAQEIQEIIPDAITTAPFNTANKEKFGFDSNYLTVDKEKIIPLLIEAIKEQQKIIENQQNQINSILNKL